MVLEAVADVAQELGNDSLLLLLHIIKDGDQCTAGAGGVVTANSVGKLEERLDYVLTAGGEPVGKVLSLVSPHRFQ